MDPITTAVLAALGQLAEPAVKDAYEAFKSLLVRKFGTPSDIVKAVETLEAKPDSAGRRETLAEEIASSGAARDTELLQLAQALLEKSRSTSGGTHSVKQHVVGDATSWPAAATSPYTWTGAATRTREARRPFMTEAGVRQTVIGDRNIVTGTGDVHIVYALPPAEAEERRSLLVLLERVSQFWITGVLEGSVHGAALLELNTARVSGAVEHPWERILELPGQDARPVPAERSIDHLFDEASRALLVLGAEGSGKTTVLLQLARALVARAERDPAQPVPVVLSLASWTGHRQELLTWIVEELQTKYYVPPRIGRSWLGQQRLALLLDGLDEVPESLRPACVEAVNRFLHDTSVPGLAVCSRLEEYLALPHRLALGGAVSLQPLSATQVQQYLIGIPLARAPFGLVWALPFALRGRRQSLHLDVQPVFGLTWSFRRAIAGALWGTLIGLALTILSVVVTREPVNVVGLLVFTGVYTLVGASFGGVTRILDAAVSRESGLRLTVRSALRGALLTGAIAGGLLGLLVLGVFVIASVVTPELWLTLTRVLGEAGWRATPLFVLLGVVLAALALAVPVGLYFAVLGALWYGALDTCQHAILRLLLWRRGTTPLGLPRLLDYGTRLVLLQRAGGGYRFVHGSLMEHIAAGGEATSSATAPEGHSLWRP